MHEDRVHRHMIVAKPGIDWWGIGEAIFRNRLGWLVSCSLIFAASPLVAWAAMSATEATPERQPDPHVPIALSDDADTERSARSRGTENPGATSDGCHPAYSGCVPIATDVDCIGEEHDTGPSDGPAFVSGPLLVLEDDVYELDPNGDLVACFDGDF